MACVRKKKNGNYEIIVSLGYNVEHKKIIKTTTYVPDKTMTEKAAKKEAERQAVLFEEKVKNGEYGNSKIKLVDFIDDIWFKEYMKGKSPSTVYRYEILTKVIKEKLGHLQLDKIRPLHIQKFKNDLSTAKSNVAIRNKDGEIIDYKTYAPKTQLHYFRCLSTILTTAYKLDMIKENPVSKVSAPKVPKKQPQFLNVEQTRNILKLLKKEQLKYQVAINILLFTGIRRGELIGLTWDAVDWENEQIKIVQNTIYVKKKIYTKDPKTETSVRVVDIPSNIIALLKEYRIYQSKERLLLGDKWVNTNRIMTQWNGKIMHPDTISQFWKDFQIRNNLKPITTLHQIRHTFATLLLSSNVDIKTVSTLLGHSDIGTTNIYVHALESTKREAAENLQKKLSLEQPSDENAI